MEHIGTITAAGPELKADKSGTIFKVHVDKVTYSLFDDQKPLQTFCAENIGKLVKVEYHMSKDEKHRNVDTIELASAEAVVISSGRDAAIATQVAAKIVTELWISEKIKDDNLLVIGLKKWLATQLNAWPDKKETPTYKDAKGNDPSRVTAKDIERLKEKLGIDPATIDGDEELEQQIILRFGYDVKMSDAECKDWIKELKTQ